MPRGQPDFGVYQSQYAIAGMADPGEAAARLGSINIYDRRGWTVWMDDFEAPALKWLVDSANGGVDPVLSQSYAWQGVQSAYLYTAAQALAYSDISRKFPLLRRGKVGVEFWVMGDFESGGYLYLALEVYDGATPVKAQLKYDATAKTIDIVTEAGDIEIATDVYMETATHYFLPIKLVVDMDTDLYTRLLVGPDEYDISEYELPALAASTDKYLKVQIKLNGGVAGVMYAYIDNVIITQNEP